MFFQKRDERDEKVSQESILCLFLQEPQAVNPMLFLHSNIFVTIF